LRAENLRRRRGEPLKDVHAIRSVTVKLTTRIKERIQMHAILPRLAREDAEIRKDAEYGDLLYTANSNA